MTKEVATQKHALREAYHQVFYREPPPPPPPPPWVAVLRSVEKRQDQRNCINFFDPASSQLRNLGGGGGGVHGKKNFFLKNFTESNPRALATRTPSLGRVGQGALELDFAQTRRRFFFSDPCVLGYIF